MDKFSVDVRPVTRLDCAPFIIGIHYAKRWPSVSFAYGIFDGDDIEGIITYGVPSSAPLRKGICGDDFSGNVIELNRLCMKNNKKNYASMLISRSIKLMGGDRIIVSYADIKEGHIGTVYKASGFMSCGMSAKRTDWKIRGKEHLHGQTVADEFRGMSNRAELMRNKYGDDFYLLERSRKFRFVRIVGSKGFRAKAMRELRYDQE